MSDLVLEDAWRCNECGTVHNDEEEAYDCCRPTISEGYLCPICKKFHLSDEEAIECHGWDPLGPPPPPTPDELEAAGQMRLLP